MVTLNPKQKEALSMLMEHKFNLLWGGARSGKTFLTCYYIVFRAIKYPNSRHLICRTIGVHVRASIWDMTLPDVLNQLKMVKGEQYTTKDMQMEVHFRNGSTIYCAGLDAGGDDSDKILGREYATIYANEVSDFKYLIFLKLRTRLSQKVEGCKNKLIVDLNPTGDNHFTHKLWFDKIEPQSLLPLETPDDYARLQLNPIDNIEHLGNDYIKDNLEILTGDARERFLDGNYQSTSSLLVLNTKQNNLFNFSEFMNWCRNREERVRIVGGMDLGASDADAVCFIAYIKEEPLLWLIYEYKAFREDISDLANGIRQGFEFVKEYLPFYANPNNIQIFADTSVIRHGAEGDKKKSYKELNRLYGFHIDAAFKRDKSIRLDLLRGEYHCCNIKIQDTGYLFTEATETVWTKNPIDGTIEHIINDDLFHPDMLFAVLYAFNYLASYGSDALIKKLNVVDKVIEPENLAISSYENFLREEDKQLEAMNKMMELLNNDNKYF